MEPSSSNKARKTAKSAKVKLQSHLKETEGHRVDKNEDDSSSTRLRPGTPAPKKNSNHDEISKGHPIMSLSDIDKVENEAKELNVHIIMGSKSAPVQSKRRNTNNLKKSKTSELVEESKRNAMLSLVELPLVSLSEEKTIIDYYNEAKINKAKFPKNISLPLSVVNGHIYIQSENNSSPPENNSFVDTRDLGPPGAAKRWLVDMTGFRDTEISFSLKGDNLKIEGRQTTRPGKRSQYSEIITLPPNANIENVKVYHNKLISKLVFAYLPPF